MTVSEAYTEPTLFDLRARERQSEEDAQHTLQALSTHDAASAVPAAGAASLAPQAREAEPPAEASEARQTAETADAAQSAQAGETGEPGETAQAAAPGATPPDEKKRLEKQLDALKRKESELRRALLVAERPELAEAIRTIQGHAYSVQRAEDKASHGLSKAEVRRRDTLDKKLTGLREKRTELDKQIEALEAEHNTLGAEQAAASQVERRQALGQLLRSLSMNAAAFTDAGIDAQSVVPELARLMPELEGFARELTDTAQS
jgi:hypothetical protein